MHHIIHSFIHSSPTHLSLLSNHPHKLPHSYITDKGRFSGAALQRPSSPARSPSRQLHPDAPGLLRGHLQPPSSHSFNSGGLHQARRTWNRSPLNSRPPLRRPGVHSGAQPVRPRTAPPAPRAQAGPWPSRLRLRAGLPGEAGTAGHAGGAGQERGDTTVPGGVPPAGKQLGTPCARPRSPPARPPHLCAPPRSQLRSRKDPPYPPWQLGSAALAWTSRAYFTAGADRTRQCRKDPHKGLLCFCDPVSACSRRAPPPECLSSPAGLRAGFAELGVRGTLL